MNFDCKYARIDGAPELRYSAAGKPYCKFNVSAKHGKDRDGKPEYGTFPCIAFGDLAESVASLPDKKTITIAGFCKQEKWDYQGKPYSKIVFLVREISKPDGSAVDAVPVAAPVAPPRQESIPDDDIPF